MRGLKENMLHLCKTKPDTTYDNTVVSLNLLVAIKLRVLSLIFFRENGVIGT